ncbi:MAG: VWA domain-containing protein, partial [Clostridia bacterium]|nr:VWA domain-containing protein [Clostridia bacterium]
MKNTNTITKIISVFVCIAMLFVYIPFSAITAKAAASDSRVVDPHTLEQWKNFFGEQENHSQNVSVTTEYAGGVWTDKSVFKPSELPQILTDATYNGQSFYAKDKGDNFVVALSAIASNKQIKGYSTIPTDTVLVLDLSSSMRYTDDNDGSAVDELVEATNKAITDLLTLNRNNRVAVVVYAGNTNKSFSVANGATTIVLPLDSYTTATRGQYLISASVGNTPDRAVEVAEGVKNSAGYDVTDIRFEVATGTYMQDGIYEAMKLLINADPVVSDGVQKGTNRMPIMVLMTDGEPTLANNDYNGNDNRTDLGTTNLSNYDGSTGEYSFRDTIAFMTSLTAAFASKEIEAHYGEELLMYTLPYGDAVLSRGEALSVLNPAQASDVQNELWGKFLNGDSIAVFRNSSGWGYNTTYSYIYTSNSAVEGEKLTAEDRMYVDKYFPARNDDEMLNAFESIVDEIVLQSKYHPTYVEYDSNHDGYLTFVDKIGTYMEVSDILGIVIGNRLFSGAALASKFPANSSSSIVAGNVLGADLLGSVKDRLGIEDESVAEALVQDAYDHGQLIYNSADDYEHYIGWFSDADGNYVDFWHMGMSSEQIAEAQAKGATHIIRSYAFLGDTAVIPGISNTDMMYMSVRLAREIGTGETIVSWRIPASLVPTVTYEVEVDVDADGNISEVLSVDLSDDSADSPIRLLYDVQLRGDLHDWNIAEKLSDTKGQDYINENGYVFYSNKWTTDPEDTTLNTYSHFEPSIQNERYYYTQDTDVLVEVSNGVYELYTGASKPSGSGYYHAYQVFEKLENGTLRIHEHYEPISEAALAVAEQNGSGWYIPKDTIHRYYDYEIADKASNETGTMNHSDHPFVVKEGEIYYTYSTQGNNGKITVEPATGLKLTKTLAE